jgi:hypothetical protein
MCVKSVRSVPNKLSRIYNKQNLMYLFIIVNEEDGSC